MLNKIYEKLKKFIKNNYKFLIIWLILIILFTYKLPYVIYTPGGAIDLSKRIEVTNGYQSTGKFKMAYVTMLNGTIPTILLSYIIPNWDIIPDGDVTMDGQSIEQTMNMEKLYMQESIDNATILAYQKAGKTVTLTKEVSHVIYIAKEANTTIELGDEIIKIGDKTVNSFIEIQKEVASFKAGETINVLVKRNNKEVNTTAVLYEIDGVSKIGVSAVNTYEYKVDPAITLKAKASESGPSGGFMMSLAIYNALVEEDISHGKTIIGTGTIDQEGNVGEIDGVKYKLIGAVNKKADIFFCPKENEKEAIEVKEKYNLNIEVKAFATFAEAINYLNEIK